MNANPKNWSILPYTASISSCVLGTQKNALIETVLLSTQNTCFGLETKKTKENLYSKFTKRVSSATVTSGILTFSKHPPFWSCAPKFLYPPKFYIRTIARVRSSSEPYLLQLCYIMHCPRGLGRGFCAYP